MERQDSKTVLKTIGVVALIAVVVAFLALAGGNEKSDNVQVGEVTYQSAKIISNDGHYTVFQTPEVQEYLNFLESFDETKYEIVDISTSAWASNGINGKFYMVTYRTIAE